MRTETTGRNSPKALLRPLSVRFCPPSSPRKSTKCPRYFGRYLENVVEGQEFLRWQNHTDRGREQFVAVFLSSVFAFNNMVADKADAFTEKNKIEADVMGSHRCIKKHVDNIKK